MLKKANTIERKLEFEKLLKTIIFFQVVIFVLGGETPPHCDEVKDQSYARKFKGKPDKLAREIEMSHHHHRCF
jgi:hypothetical protein